MAKKKEKENTDLAVQDAGPLAAAPDYLQQSDAPLGMQNMRPEDMLIPRVTLMQALSPSVVEGQHRPGVLINSLSKEVIAEIDASVAIIPIFHYLEWLKWGDRDLNEGILDRSLDPDGALATSCARGDKIQRGGKEVMVVTECHNFICLMPDISLTAPIMIGCSRSNHKKGKQLLTLSKYRGKYDLFAGRYMLSSADEKNKKNQIYKVFDFQNAGWASSDEHELCAKLYPGIKEAYDSRALKVDEDVSDERDTSGLSPEERAEASGETEL